ncbi:hypothetical protein [Chromobacterium rhizoryzae]|uniref:Uncharacterized protein n=1 Tax=Chromobacterium rhizoryzae TaxID=1778675 RepID=A0AAD0W8W4_9NEIS|nr:hypothetical protein [Chromobacterium rhizoryzae]AXT47754.1 hypothetical protein D1345_16925 [Chromobacterium rhizoryzae]
MMIRQVCKSIKIVLIVMIFFSPGVTVFLFGQLAVSNPGFIKIELLSLGGVYAFFTVLYLKLADLGQDSKAMLRVLGFSSIVFGVVAADALTRMADVYRIEDPASQAMGIFPSLQNLALYLLSALGGGFLLMSVGMTVDKLDRCGRFVSRMIRVIDQGAESKPEAKTQVDELARKRQKRVARSRKLVLRRGAAVCHVLGK